MVVTEFTREAAAYRRFRRQALADGYEQVSDNGHPLWELSRGARWQHVIVDARVAPDGKSVWVKIEEEPR